MGEDQQAELRAVKKTTGREKEQLSREPPERVTM
jgi:hypothetical protein